MSLPFPPSSPRDNVAQVFEPRDALSPNLSLALIQLFLWLALVFLVSRRNVWQSGIFSKAMALLTLAMLVAMVAVGLTFRESGAGLYAVFKVRPSNLAKPDIWVDALGQVRGRDPWAVLLIISRILFLS